MDTIEEGVGMMSVPELELLAGWCSPIAVYIDGKLMRHKTSVRGVRYPDNIARMPGSTSHADDRLYFSTPDGSDPSSGEHEYTIGLRRAPGYYPHNVCGGRFWVLPGDTITVHVKTDGLKVFHEGANVLTLSGHARGSMPNDVRLHVAVRLGNRVVGERSFHPTALQGDAAIVPLKRRVRPNARRVSVTITNPAERAFVLMSKGTLVEANDHDMGRMQERVRAWEAELLTRSDHQYRGADDAGDHIEGAAAFDNRF